MVIVVNKEGKTQTMKNITLRPAEVDRDFGQLAILFSNEQDELISETALKADYDEHKERIFRLMVAENEQGELLGFNWATRSRFDETQAYFYVIVKPGHRGQGAGCLLYTDVEQTAKASQINQLQISIRDDCPQCQSFAQSWGFAKQSHRLGMMLNLNAFDEGPTNKHITRLQSEGFQFTSMATLGNTQEAQRKLYALNDMTSMEAPGSEGKHSWLSFEDFQRKVCQADWYQPAGQMVVIDTATGTWAAMSAITRFEGTDYAYNLHTGVDKRYRGRKLGQAVKAAALRYARDVLRVNLVRTHHNVENLPMISIDRKFGYVQTPGILSMKKTLSLPSGG
jgi:RimJ/RimL family protein N-acetyltransferase